MKCANSYMPAILIAIPLLAMALDVRAQQQLPGQTYAANNHPKLFRPWTCEAIPLTEYPSPPAPEPVSQFAPQDAGPAGR